MAQGDQGAPLLPPATSFLPFQLSSVVLACAPRDLDLAEAVPEVWGGPKYPRIRVGLQCNSTVETSAAWGNGL